MLHCKIESIPCNPNENRSLPCGRLRFFHINGGRRSTYRMEMCYPCTMRMVLRFMCRTIRCAVSNGRRRSGNDAQAFLFAICFGGKITGYHTFG